VNTVPTGPLSVDEDNTLSVTGVSVSDPDAAGAPLKVTLAVTQGTLATDDTTGVAASGGGTATLTLTGSATDLNTALATLRYTPGANYAGDDTLTVTTDDQGNTGDNGAKNDVDTVAITVGAGQRRSGRAGWHGQHERGHGGHHRPAAARVRRRDGGRRPHL